jgi:hypothetical protein
VIAVEDVEAPSVSASLAGPTDELGSHLGSATLTLEAGDDISGVGTIEYRVNGAEWIGTELEGALTESIDVEFDERRRYKVEYRATDSSPNANVSAAQTIVFRIITACPVHSDEFDGLSLDTDRWSFRHPTTPAAGAGAPSVVGGELVLPLGAFSLDLTRPGPVAIIGQPLPEEDFTLEAKISAPGLNTSNGGGGSAYAQVGFKVFQSDDDWIKVAHTRNADGGGSTQTYFEMAHETSGVRTLGTRMGLAAAATNLPTWWMRVTRTDDVINAFYSLSDPDGPGGAEWVDLGLSPNVATTLPGEGPIYIGPYGGNGNTTATFEYIRFGPDELVGCDPDTQAPTTEAVLDPAEPGPGGAYDGPVAVTLAAEDDEGGSGVDYTEYRLDGGEWALYDPLFPPGFSAPGAYEIEYRSVDLAGNAEEPNSIAFTIEEPYVGSPALDLVVRPRARRVKVGSRATFTATTTNTGDADASEVEACAKAPARKAKIVGKACATAAILEPEASFAPKFTLKPKRAARGKRVKVSFVATAAGAEPARASALLKVRR